MAPIFLTRDPEQSPHGGEPWVMLCLPHPWELAEPPTSRQIWDAIHFAQSGEETIRRAEAGLEHVVWPPRRPPPDQEDLDA